MHVYVKICLPALAYVACGDQATEVVTILATVAAAATTAPAAITAEAGIHRETRLVAVSPVASCG